MNTLARLLFPALRWNEATGFAHEMDAIDAALALGVGGFCLFGGVAGAVRELTAELRSRSAHPLLIAADLERGAGQQFDGAVQLPPFAAIGHVDDVEVTRRAARITAREALALGVNWIYAPVADIDLEPRNPIIGTRAAGTDADTVARHVAAWIDGCHDEGVLCCAKHFPGHGRTTGDSHIGLPRVDASPAEMTRTDLVPFRTAIEHDVDAVMTAHVCYPALDGGDFPATLSPAILTELLRGRLGHRGLIVTDAMIMEGLRAGGGSGEAEAALRALAAGCDALLYPEDLHGVADALRGAAATAVSPERTEDALARVADAAERAPTFRDAPVGTSADHAWAIDLGARAAVVSRGAPGVPRAVRLITIDDDVGGPYAPPSREPFAEALRDAGYDVRTGDADAGGDRAVLVAVYSDIRGWKGRPGLSANARAGLERLVADSPDARIVLFGHPRLAADLPGQHILSVWGGEAVMQRAAAKRLRELGGD